MEPTELATMEDELLGLGPIKRSDVRDFTAMFLESTGGKICQPYIVGPDGEEKYGKVPAEHRTILNAMIERADRDSEREKAAAQSDSPGSGEVDLAELEEFLRNEGFTVHKRRTTRGMSTTFQGPKDQSSAKIVRRRSEPGPKKRRKDERDRSSGRRRRRRR
jgi:hypothetical protein